MYMHLYGVPTTYLPDPFVYDVCILRKALDQPGGGQGWQRLSRWRFCRFCGPRKPQQFPRRSSFEKYQVEDRIVKSVHGNMLKHRTAFFGLPSPATFQNLVSTLLHLCPPPVDTRSSFQLPACLVGVCGHRDYPWWGTNRNSGLRRCLGGFAAHAVQPSRVSTSTDTLHN